MADPIAVWPKENYGPYLHIISDTIKAISIFDALHYDRADVDIISPVMRLHLIKKLKDLGFKQTQGRVIENKTLDIKCVIPKFHALGSSPFHITDYTSIRPQDYYVLTPTQTACFIINNFPLETAMEKLKQLIAVQPINIKRISDYIENSGVNLDALSLIGHLKYYQAQALETPELKSIKPLSLTRH